MSKKDRGKKGSKKQDQDKALTKYVPRNGGKLFATPQNDITIPFYSMEQRA